MLLVSLILNVGGLAVGPSSFFRMVIDTLLSLTKTRFLYRDFEILFLNSGILVS